MLCYFEFYRPMLIWKAPARGVGGVSDELQKDAPRRGALRKAFLALGNLALALGAWNLYLFIGLICA